MNKSFLCVLYLAALLGWSLADVVPQHPNPNQPGGPPVQNVNQFAENREYGAPTTSGFTDGSFSSQPFQKSSGVTYSSGNSFYASEPAFSFGGNIGPIGGGIQSTGNFFTGNLINTGLTIVFGLFAFSLIMQLLTKVASSSFFDDLFEARSLDRLSKVSPEDITYYTNLLMDGYKKFEELNRLADVPK